MSYWDFDCDKCANLNIMCSECEHEEREDYYEEATPELLAQRKAEEFKRWVNSIPKQMISVHISDEFMESFSIAKVYASDRIPRFYCVYCGPDYLLASDTRRLIKITTDVPEQLRDKHIIDIQDGEVSIHLDPATVFKDGAALKLFDVVNTQMVTDKQRLTELLTEYKDRHYEGSWIDKKFILQNQFIKDILELISDDEEFTITYAGQVDSVTFKFRNYEILVMPVRPQK